MTIRAFRIYLNGMILLALLSGCVISETEKSVNRIEHEAALHSEMRAMAESLSRILQLNLDSKITDEARLDGILDELELVETIATGIGREEVITNYAVIDQYIGAFLYDVGIAKKFALREPPNYFPANRLIKSCLGCHQSL